MRAVVIGSMNMDFTSTVEHLPIKGETIAASRLRISPGGKGLNQAVALARLGADVMMIGAVGQDDAGKSILGNLPKDGISGHTIKVTNKGTGNAFITVDLNGNNTIVVYPGANYELSSDWVESFADEIKNADFAVLQMEIPLETVINAIHIAHSLGTKVVLNPAPARPLSLEVYPMIDLIVPNESELSILTSEKHIVRGVEKLLGWGSKAVVVTLGAKGCFYKDATQELTVEGYKVSAVDSTAAGDAFIGGLLVAMGRGDDMQAAMRYANAVGALTVTKPGAQDSIPTYEEVNSFLGRQDQ